jgi:hypothetical protein
VSAIHFVRQVLSPGLGRLPQPVVKPTGSRAALALEALTASLSFSEHPDQHRPERPVLLAIDQQLGEGTTLRVAPELSDPICPVALG